MARERLRSAAYQCSADALEAASVMTSLPFHLGWSRSSHRFGADRRNQLGVVGHDARLAVQRAVEVGRTNCAGYPRRPGSDTARGASARPTSWPGSGWSGNDGAANLLGLDFLLVFCARLFEPARKYSTAILVFP